jgi:hypothetical protein
MCQLSRRRVVASLLLLAATAQPPAVAGHGGGLPWIYIEAEQIWPGQPFHVLVLDLAPFVNVNLEAETGDLLVQLGQLATGPQGHGETDVTLPADFPQGYAQLRGIGDDGTSVNTPLRVGDVPATGGQIGPTGPAGQPRAPAPWWTDPSVWTLAVLLGGAALLLVLMAIRRRPAAVPATEPASAPVRRARHRKRR